MRRSPGVDDIKLYFFVNEATDKKARLFVPGMLFGASIIIIRKVPYSQHFIFFVS